MYLLLNVAAQSSFSAFYEKNPLRLTTCENKVVLLAKVLKNTINLI